MFYTDLNQKNKGKFLQSLYKSEEELGAESLQKSEDADLLKGRKAEPIGTKKVWGGQEYVKTAQGWSASKKAVSAHNTIHGSNTEGKKDEPKELTPDEHGAEAAKHFDEAQKEYFKGHYDKSNEHHEKGHEHLMHALGKQKDKFNAVYNNSEVKHITVGGSNKPLSSQLEAIHGDHYNAQDYDGDASTGSIITHKKSGEKYTVINHKQADLVKHYQEKNKEAAVEAPDFDKAAKKIKKLTENNDHTTSLIEVAKLIGNKDAEASLKDLSKQHEKLGHMPYDLQVQRHDIYNKLLQEIQKKHGTEAYKKIHSSL